MVFQQNAPLVEIGKFHRDTAEVTRNGGENVRESSFQVVLIRAGIIFGLEELVPPVMFILAFREPHILK